MSLHALVNQLMEVRVTDQIRRECQQLLNDLYALPAADLFREPVDPEADGIPEYRDVISTPMDLGTVRVCFLLLSKWSIAL